MTVYEMEIKNNSDARHDIAIILKMLSWRKQFLFGWILRVNDSVWGENK